MKTSTSSRLTRMLVAALFSEKVCIAVVATFSIAAFFLAITDHPRLCSACVAIQLPHFITALRYKG